jgi:hypothetical protein
MLAKTSNPSSIKQSLSHKLKNPLLAMQSVERLLIATSLARTGLVDDTAGNDSDISLTLICTTVLYGKISVLYTNLYRFSMIFWDVKSI